MDPTAVVTTASTNPIVHFFATTDSADAVRLLTAVGIAGILYVLNSIKKTQRFELRKVNRQLRGVNHKLHNFDVKFAKLDGQLDGFTTWKTEHDKRDDAREDDTKRQFDGVAEEFREVRRTLHAMPER